MSVCARLARYVGSGVGGLLEQIPVLIDDAASDAVRRATAVLCEVDQVLVYLLHLAHELTALFFGHASLHGMPGAHHPDMAVHREGVLVRLVEAHVI